MLSPKHIVVKESMQELLSDDSATEIEGKAVKTVKLEVDDSGQKFINLNGKKLKVINKTQVPRVNSDGKNKQMVVKHKTINIGSASSPMKVRVISKVTQVNPQQSLLKIASDKAIKTTTDNKTYEVNKTITDSIIFTSSTFTNYEENSSSESDPILYELPKSYKLLSDKNLKVLEFVKMKALNLSLKDEENLKKPPKIYSEASVQTETLSYCEKANQTSLESLLDLDFNSWLDFNSQDPVLNNVTLGTGPEMGKVILPTKNINNCTERVDSKSDNIKKKILFFQDLRNALIPDANGNLLIHEGVLKNDIALVKRMCIVLRARHADVNQENHDGWTPLQLAVINNVQHDIVQLLLDYGAEIGDCDGDGNNIIHLAAKFERIEILQVIFNHKMYDSSYSQYLDNFNFEGLTPLMICCMAGWYEGVELFLLRGGNVNLRDQKSGRTALFHAAEIHHEEIVRLLLEHRADAKIKNFFGTSPHDAMYELDEMKDSIKNLIFGKTKKRTIEAEMNPVRTAKAAKVLKTYPKFKKIENRDGMIMLSTGIKASSQQLPQRQTQLRQRPTQSSAA